MNLTVLLLRPIVLSHDFYRVNHLPSQTKQTKCLNGQINLTFLNSVHCVSSFLEIRHFDSKMAADLKS